MSSNCVVKIKPSYTAIAQSIFYVIFSTLPFALVYTTRLNPGFLSIIFLCIPSLILFYCGIEKLFIKKIAVIDNNVLFSNGPFRYQLNRETLTVYCEKIFVFGGNYKDYIGLVLYRDKNKIVGFSANNKFVIAYEIDEVKLDYYQQEFKNKIGIDIKVIKPFL